MFFPFLNLNVFLWDSGLLSVNFKPVLIDTVDNWWAILLREIIVSLLEFRNLCSSLNLYLALGRTLISLQGEVDVFLNELAISLCHLLVVRIFARLIRRFNDLIAVMYLWHFDTI